MKADFTKKLLQWNQQHNTRAMPWKGEKNPYRIWLSEIILQQTRVEQGLAYYQRFIEHFPTIHDLANAPDKEVFKLWEGLGYYTRCKNLLATARYISTSLNGAFPSTYASILALKGIGPYTAAAIGSFAFNLPHAVTDGNVLRVLSRYFGISTPIDTTEGKKRYDLLAAALLDKKEPGVYNQAIMDFGAVICKPQQPLCTECPQKKECRALATGAVKLLPVKEKQLVKKTRWFYYLVVQVKDEVLIRKRTGKDIWQNLYEYVLVETEGLLEEGQPALQKMVKQYLGRQSFSIERVSAVYAQQLTHQTINGRFIEITTNQLPPLLNDYELVKKASLLQFPFPKFITAYQQRGNEPLQLF
ncbi:MAG TPA: A/G-specific adenine glycosylase [Chitinophagaceae bacterium]|nr:A/G-specific adenine glycosylase [Chitinophagaceae bacterium]